MNNLKIPNSQQNKLLITDSNGKIVNSDIHVDSLDNAISVKHYYLDISDLKNNTQITLESHSSIYNTISNIVSDFNNSVCFNINLRYDLYGISNTNPCISYAYIVKTEDNNICICTPGINKVTLNTDGTSTLDICYTQIQIQCSAENTITSIQLVNSSVSLPGTSLKLLTCDNTTDDTTEWLPTTQSQPANKKYVDQEISKLEGKIGTIESTVDTILGNQ